MANLLVIWRGVDTKKARSTLQQFIVKDPGKEVLELFRAIDGRFIGNVDSDYELTLAKKCIENLRSPSVSVWAEGYTEFDLGCVVFSTAGEDPSLLPRPPVFKNLVNTPPIQCLLVYVAAPEEHHKLLVTLSQEEYEFLLQGHMREPEVLEGRYADMIDAFQGAVFSKEGQGYKFSKLITVGGGKLSVDALIALESYVG